jgi:hypothetical protein
MVEARQLRDRAARCTTLAQDMTDPAIIAELEAIASGYEAEAVVLEAARHLASTYRRP